jgi:hypothetical protein
LLAFNTEESSFSGNVKLLNGKLTIAQSALTENELINDTLTETLKITGRLNADTFHKIRLVDDVTIARNLNVVGTITSPTITTINSNLTALTNLFNGHGHTITAGAGLTGGGTFVYNGINTLSLAHADTSSQNSVSLTETISATNGQNANGGFVFKDLTLDGFGHITAIATKNLDDRYYRKREIDAGNKVQVLTGSNVGIAVENITGAPTGASLFTVASSA